MTGARRKRQSGITLMELLIAITLLSLLAGGMLFAMRLGLDAKAKTDERFLSNRRVLGVERILSEQIAGFIPTKADCRADSGAVARRVPFFQGDGQTMRFVSSFSLQEAARGYPRILEFQVIPGAQSMGVRLIVNEILYSGPYSTGLLCTGQQQSPAADGSAPRVLFRPVQILPGSFVIADKLAYCRFVYREEREIPQPPLWHSTWTKPTTPAAVRIEMAPLEAGGAKLQVPTFTAPFRPNRNPGINYGEIM